MNLKRVLMRFIVLHFIYLYWQISYTYIGKYQVDTLIHTSVNINLFTDWYRNVSYQNILIQRMWDWHNSSLIQ